MGFINYKQLCEDVEDFAKQLPKFDMVVGLPRSGMLPATMLSSFWNVPLGYIDDGYIINIGMGKRCQPDKLKNILVIDDSLYTGDEIRKARAKLGDKYNLSYAVMYPAQGTALLDYYYKIVPGPRCFQWNVIHHPLTNKICFDMDGLLCEDPTKEQNDYGDKYEDFMKTTKPLYRPSYPVHTIVTGRLAKYKEQTVEWLNKHGIKFNNLVMRKDRNQNIATMKGNYYKTTNCILFLESEIRQCEQIAMISNKPVLCTTDWRVYENV